MKLIHRLALAFHRDQAEQNHEKRGFWPKASKYGVYAVLFVGCLFFMVNLFSSEIDRWSVATPEVPVPRKAWKVMLDPAGADCPISGEVTTRCPAHPDQPALWNSEDGLVVRISDKQYQAYKNQSFWLGLTVDKDMLQQIAGLRANHLVLGLLKGEYQIWVNGEFFLEGSQRDREPLILDFSWNFLTQKNQLKVAIRVKPEAGAVSPALLAKPLKEGFASHERANAFRGLWNFWKKTRPFSLILLNVVFSGFFFFLWSSEPVKREYFYIALYALVSALFQLRLSDLFISAFNSRFIYGLDTFLRVTEGALGMFLGFSFSRVRRPVFQWGLPLFFALSVISSWALQEERSHYRFNIFLDQSVIPLFYVMGATACLIQALHLGTRVSEGRQIRSRFWQLILFSAGLIGIAVINTLQSYEALSFLQRALFSRFAHFNLVLFLGGIALLEYRSQKRLIEQTPVSPYHRRPNLAESVTGAVLVIDLKNSEALFRAEAERNGTGWLVETCLSHMWTAVTNEGGVILQTEGDQLRAFFDRDTCGSPMLSALKAAESAANRLAELSEQFSLRELAFRGGIAPGQIRPIWQEVGHSRLAAWMEVGNQHPLLESVRMMELEKELAEGGSGSLVLMSEEAATSIESEMAELKGEWAVRHRALVGKHSRIYQVAAFRPFIAKVSYRATG